LFPLKKYPASYEQAFDEACYSFMLTLSSNRSPMAVSYPKHYGQIVLLLTMLLVFHFPGKANPLVEGTVTIMGKTVHHQGINKLDISIHYIYKSGFVSYVDDSALKHDVDSILKNYPDTVTWWEIVNKKLTAVLIKKYHMLGSLTSDILVHWVSGMGVEYGHRYPTHCVTTRSSNGQLSEFFGFTTLPDYTVKIRGKTCKAQLSILYKYKDNIVNTEYPDGLATENTFKKLIAGRSEKGVKNITSLIRYPPQDMLKKYPAMQNIEVIMKTHDEQARVFYKREKASK
jgi:hypothetical protein